MELERRRSPSSRTGALAALGLLACLHGSACTTEAAVEPTALRFSGIPDADKDKLAKQFGAVADWLTAELGVKAEYVHAPDYVGAVTALAANKVDLAWLGGVTAVQAEQRTDGHARFVATRENDLQFKSYFIANRALVDQGRFQEAAGLEPMPVEALKAMAPALAQSTFTFGDKSSTSGHFMPRHFLEGVGIDPETAFRGRAAFQLQGGHSATLQAVATGTFDVGALNYTAYEKADAETRAKAPVIYVTPTYVDYCFVGHDRLGEPMLARLREAFVNLDPNVPAEKAVLDAFSAPRFVAADPAQWDGIRAVLASATEKGVLK